MPTLTARTALPLALIAALALPAQADDDTPWPLALKVAKAKVIVSGEVKAISDRFVAVTRDHVAKAYEATIERVGEPLAGEAPARFVVHYTRRIGLPTPFREVAFRQGKRYLFYLLPRAGGGFELTSPYFGAERSYHGLEAEVRAELRRLARKAPPAKTAPPAKPAPPAEPQPERPARTQPQPPPAKPEPQAKAEGPPPPAAGEVVAGLQLIARLQHGSQPAPGGKLWLIVRNTGRDARVLYVAELRHFCRLQIQRLGQPRDLPVRAPEGEPAPPTRASFGTLAPGGYTYLQLDLARAQLTPGRYRARVTLDLPPAYRGEALGLDGWTGVARSGWVTIEITAASKGDAKDKAQGARPAQRWRLAGRCDGPHIGAGHPGHCQRCKGATRDARMQLCDDCAEHLDVCAACRKSR